MAQTTSGAVSSIFSDRRRENILRLEGLQGNLRLLLQSCEPATASPEVCVYVTGSLARHEATCHSDLDAFFLLSGSRKGEPLSRIRDVKILNAVVTACEKQGFPDFSNDGEYLKFLHIEDILSHIGGRRDDYQNALTARMLLILESCFLYNETLYDGLRMKIINHYFQDFHQHVGEFRPIFLINDILRFWRTMCLNYENARHWRGSDIEQRAKGHLANLKLRFSRLNICFSFIGCLLSRGQALAPEDVLIVSQLTPTARLQKLAEFPVVSGFVDILLQEYAWFLEATGHDKSTVLEWIGKEENRTEAFSHSDRFVSAMFETVKTVAEKNGYLRFLVI